VEIARAETRDEAMAGLERWKARHPDIVKYFEPADILVDGMRGRSALWYRIRVNLIHVPEGERPSQEPLESDYDPWAGQDIEAWKAATAGPRARRPAPKAKAKGT
jgi:bifunctional non-homologous end joining protein LigD